MPKLRAAFVDKGLKNGFLEKDLNILFDQIEKFSGYSFNSAHAYAYSIITCQTAFLSYYYPLEFYTALLTIDSGSQDDVRSYIKALKKRAIDIKSPDINFSEDGFIIKDESIMFGFSAIKGVGAAVSKKIVKNKPKSGYTSFGHFICRNIDILNKTILEQYIKGGCFTNLGYNKETLLTAYPKILEFISILKDINTYTIFDLKCIKLEEYIESFIVRINAEDKPHYEIQSLGLYLNKHPLDDYVIESQEILPIQDFFKCDDRDVCNIIGAISGIQVKKTKAKVNMASFNITSPDGDVKAVIFPREYPKLMHFLHEGEVMVFSGMARFDNDENILMVSKINKEWQKHLRLEKKVMDFCSVYDNFDTDSETLCFRINDNLKYILKKR